MKNKNRKFKNNRKILQQIQNIYNNINNIDGIMYLYDK